MSGRTGTARADRFLRRHRAPVGWALFAATLALLVATLDDPGITWDEPAYYGSAQLQVLWVKKALSEGPVAALDREVVWEMWDWDHYHNPHPPLYKEGMALTWWSARGILGPLAAFRLFPAILFAGLVLLLFRWGCSAWGGFGGLGAALSTLLMPRLFGHAHIGATETPLMVWWVVATAAGWWAIDRRNRAGWIVAGLAWGLAIGTKFTGLAALVPILVYALWKDRAGALRGGALAGLSALAVFVVLNPLIWTDPGHFFETWLWESLHRADYAPIATYYLGRDYGFGVPWHHVFVLTGATVPVGILSLAGLAGFIGIRRRDPLTILASGSVAFVWSLMLFPTAPHHDGIRQFVVLFPFLGLLAGYGFHVAAGLLEGRRLTWLAVLIWFPAVFQMAGIHPYHLAYYGEAVGGIKGAHERGLETTYWMDVVTEDALTWMNEELPEGATVFVVGSEKTLELSQGLGRLRRDIEFTQHLPADYMLVPMRQSMIVPRLREALEQIRPIYEIRAHGIRLLGIYDVGS